MMSTAVMTERMAEASPRFMARMAGVFYLLIFVGGFDMLFVFGRFVVRGDAAASAANILSHEPLFLAGFAAALLAVAFYIVVTALLYGLFEPVNRNLSLLAAFFSLTGCAIQALALVFHLAPLVVLGDAPYLSAFKVEQLRALAMVFLTLYGRAYNIGLPFFGFYLLLIGYLIFRSTFMPRYLGVLVAVAGPGWLTFLSPPLARHLFPYILLSGLGEGLLILWLLVKGVDEQRWKEQASAARFVHK